MNSPFANLFSELKTLLMAVSGVRFVDLDWNQLDFENPPISYPAVLVDFPETSFSQFQRHQNGRVLVRLKIIYASFTNTSSLTPGDLESTGLAFFELEQAIYEALQTKDASGLLADVLIRKSAITEKRDDGLRVRVVDFECSYIDSTVTS